MPRLRLISPDDIHLDNVHHCICALKSMCGLRAIRTSCEGKVSGKLRRVKFVSFPFISTGIIYINNIHLDNVHHQFFPLLSF